MANDKDGAASTASPVRSILDTDLYKFTMQQVVLAKYPDAKVSYRFTNRTKSMRFTRRSVEHIKRNVQGFASLALTADEHAWLSKECPYLKPGYLSYLSSFRFKPQEQVDITFEPSDGQPSVNEDEEEWGDLSIVVKGDWKEVILYEVPLMATVSEVYFTDVETKWDMTGQRTQAQTKGSRLVSNGIRFSEFGTRRRRSYETHKAVIEGLLAGEAAALKSVPSDPAGKLLGTSNVHFAQMFGLVPVGTVAHEWTMAVAALEGYENANLHALKHWDQVYAPPEFVPNSPAHDLTIALTDTFSTRVFWEDLLSSEEGKEVARRWRGLRQDSGDSKDFARRAKAAYDSLGVDAKTKVVIYSDALHPEKCIDLAQYSKDIGIGAGFGIGTNLTNDFRQLKESSSDPSGGDLDGVTPDESLPKSKALNIVIKLDAINGRKTVKISDELTKNTGDKDEVAMVKRRFGLDTEHVEDA